jgi:hypothetical protein
LPLFPSHSLGGLRGSYGCFPRTSS